MTELSILDLDDSFQIRVETKEEKIQQYADYFLERDGWGDFPPIQVVYINGKYMIADGIHRFNAAKRAGLEMIPCDLVTGNYETLLDESVKKNGIQGIDMGPKDWKKFRRLAMEALCKGLIENRTMTDMSKLGRCSVPTITSLRREMETEGWKFPETVVRADGKEYPTKLKQRENSHFKNLKCENPVDQTFCANGCGTPIWDEMKENPDCQYVERDGHWFCSEECAEERNQNRLSDEAERLTGISDDLPPNPTAKLPTKANPINYPTYPAEPVKTDSGAVSGDVLEDFTDVDEPENILRLEISKNDDETTIAGKISQIFDFVAPPYNINNLINILINNFNLNLNLNIIGVNDKKSGTKKSKKDEPLSEEQKTGFIWKLNDGSDWELPKSELETFKTLYPAVDVEQALRTSIGWNLSEPTRRKTKKGILKHINTWLANQQNRGGGKSSGYNNGNQYTQGRKRGYVSRDAGLDFEHVEY